MLIRLCSALAASVLLLPAAPAHAAVPDCFGKKPTIVGTEGDDNIEGSEKADVIQGLGGHDAIYPGSGTDVSRGGAGDDRIVANPGHDQSFNGGPGTDRVDFDSAYEPMRINLTRGTARGDGGEYTVKLVEDVEAGYAAGVIIGTDGPNVIDGGAGHDSCTSAEENTSCEA